MAETSYGILKGSYGCLIATGLATKKEAREQLKAILREYRKEWRGVKGIFEYNYWLTKHSIVVHLINNDGTINRDTIIYRLVYEYSQD